MSRRRFPRRRRWPRIGVAIASVALLAPGLKAGSMFWFSEAGARAYDDGGYDDSIDAFRRLESWNVIDPSLAFVGIGDAWYRQGDLVEAELAFARALDLAPGDCEVRFNLAVTLEAQGDRVLAREPLSPDDEDRPFDPAAPAARQPVRALLDRAGDRHRPALRVRARRRCRRPPCRGARTHPDETRRPPRRDR